MLKNILKITIILILILILTSLSFAESEEAMIIHNYKETIAIKKTGAAEVTVEVTMGEYEKDELYLPLNYIWVEKIEAEIVETGRSLDGEIKTLEGTDYLYLDLKGNSLSEKTLRISFRDPAFLIWKNAGPGEFGLYNYKYEFMNTTGFFIETYEMEILFPEGYIINDVLKSIPKYDNKDPAPPYSWKNLSDGSRLYTGNKNLSLGKTCMIEYSFAKKEKSPVIPVICIILIILYLLFFRDTLKEVKKK